MAHSATNKTGIPGVLTSQNVRVRRNLRDLSFLYSTVLAALIFISVLFLYIWCRLAVVNTGYEISSANLDRDAFIEQNKRLKFEFMELKSPERIEGIASGELGLVHPTGEQIVRVR
ncbi:MAG TPA: hypothetical protein VJM57_05740 [Thermodesulfobacteriota bacterium]|nr:hypothetical protein [Thermodesulfobacteriota bacterium]